MALSDIYVATSGLQTISLTTADLPVLAVTTPSTKRIYITGIRFSIANTSAAANNAVTVKLCRSSTAPTGGTTITPRPHDAASPASLMSFCATPSYTIAPVNTSVLGQWTIPQTSGSMWEEFPPGGQEWVMGTSVTVGVFVTLTVATGTPITTDLVWSE